MGCYTASRYVPKKKKECQTFEEKARQKERKIDRYPDRKRDRCISRQRALKGGRAEEIVPTIFILYYSTLLLSSPLSTYLRTYLSFLTRRFFGFFFFCCCCLGGSGR